MNRKKWTYAIIPLATLVLAGCGNQQNSATSGNQAIGQASSKVKLTMIYAGGDPNFKEQVANTVAAFTKANPNVEIDATDSGTGVYDDFLKTKDAVGQFPDIVDMRNTTQDYVKAGKLAPLPSDIVNLFNTTAQFNGKVYDAPYDGGQPLGIMYNKKYFNDHSLDEHPKTYADFIDLNKKIKSLGASPLVVGGKDIWHLGFWFTQFMNMNVYAQTPNWNADRTANKVSWTDPAPLKALTQYTDLIKNYAEPGFLSVADNQTASYLVSGKAEMLFSGPWMFSQIKSADPNFQLGWFPVPDENGNVVLAGTNGSQGWAISAKDETDQTKMKAATDFIKFFFSKDQYGNYLQAMSTTPSTKENATYTATGPLKELLDVYNQTSAQNKIPTWNTMIGSNQIPPQFRDWTYKLSESWLLGQSNPASDTKKMDAEWNKEEKDLAQQ